MKKMMFLMLTLLVWGVASMNAQVTIGSEQAPHAGAVLDLQADNLGLKFPNVALDANLNKFGLDSIANPTSPSSKENAVGMVVYNTNSNFPGLYVWNGSQWLMVSKNEDYPKWSTITSGSNTYACRTYLRGVGTWMISNSKEGNPSVKYYTGTAAGGDYGYFYTRSEANTACPSGFRLPKKSDVDKLTTWLYNTPHATLAAAWFGALYGRVSENTTTHELSAVERGNRGYFWLDDATQYLLISPENPTLATNWTTTGWQNRFNVRCMHD
ncbi:hypothetical protein FACS189437_04690 [Bacteroidia bacterium]|nr:hypothetical protein FACS189437_04690 [Bacteroidia bacterium]